jgi:class 3 adenylate cyclase
MPQLHTYVPKNLAARVAARAKARGVAVSRYLADLIRRDVELGWPDDFFDRVAGGWKGAPLRRAPQGRPEDREAW